LAAGSNNRLTLFPFFPLADLQFLLIFSLFFILLILLFLLLSPSTHPYTVFLHLLLRGVRMVHHFWKLDEDRRG